jgi:hypothetical protein
MVIFFAVAHLDRHPESHSFRSHMRRAAPLYLLCMLLVAIMISGSIRGNGFWEFGEIYLIPFLIFLGGILGDLVYYLKSRGRISRG